jgi:hypothetical protein
VFRKNLETVTGAVSEQIKQSGHDFKSAPLKH